VSIPGTSVINFRYNRSKERNAGKIGYGTFDSSALCIVGLGSDSTNRLIRFYDKITAASVSSNNASFINCSIGTLNNVSFVNLSNLIQKLKNSYWNSTHLVQLSTTNACITNVSCTMGSFTNMSCVNVEYWYTEQREFH
jgi:hypothetical protein